MNCLKVSENNPNFTNISTFLLTKCSLIICGIEYKLAEIEVYFNGKAHPDPFVHMNEQQTQFGTWYFHKGGKSLKSKYKSGTYKGLDIVFAPSTDCYAGILIRSIKDPTGKLIEGPCNCVNHILSLGKVTTIQDFIDTYCQNLSVIETKNSGLFLRETPRNNVCIYACPRVGLSLKKDLPGQPDYIMKHYRFLTDPKGIKKGKVYIVLALLAKELENINDEKDNDVIYATIRSITGTNTSTIKRYHQYLKEGNEKPLPKDTSSKSICFIYGSCK